MTRPLPHIPIFVRLLDALPIKIANGFALVESDVSECLVVELFGQRMTLPVQALSAGDGGRELLFEGTMAHPVLEMPNVFTLSIPQLRIGITSTSSSLAFESLAMDIMGRVRIELHLPAIFNTKPIFVEGTLHFASKNAIVANRLRIDLDEGEFSLPLPFGISLRIKPNSLEISWREDRSFSAEMTIACSVAGLPQRIQNVITKTSFEANIRWSKDGMTIATTTLCEGVRIPLPSFAAFGGSPAWNLDELTFSAKYMRISLGQTIECSLDVGVDIPVVLHEFMEPHIDLRLSSLDDDVRIELLSSPIRALDCIRVPNGNLRARLRVGDGRISFDIPSLRIDWARRRFIAEGQFSHQNLRIPLAPIRALLERARLFSIAQRLPDSIAVQSFELTSMAAAFSNMLSGTSQGGIFSEQMRALVNNSFEKGLHWAQRVQDNFFRVHVPQKLAFQVECTFDFDVRVHVAPSNDPIRTEKSPIRLLAPHLGPSGPELLGITLYRWSFGELRAGQVFTVELDAELESFELLPILRGSQHPTHLRVELRDVAALVGQSGGVPWIMPTNFRQIGLSFNDFDEVQAGFQCSLSSPKVDFKTLIHTLVQRDDLPRSELNLSIEARVGPAFLRLPRRFGGKLFGSTDKVLTLRSPREIDGLLNAWQSFDVNELIDMVLVKFGPQDVEIEIGPDHWDVMRSRLSVLMPLVDYFQNDTVARAARRFRLHLERVTTSGLQARADVPDFVSGKPKTIYWELPWTNIFELETVLFRS